jgi:hypothetical protein
MKTILSSLVLITEKMALSYKNTVKALDRGMIVQFVISCKKKQKE